MSSLSILRVCESVVVIRCNLLSVLRWLERNYVFSLQFAKSWCCEWVKVWSSSSIQCLYYIVQCHRCRVTLRFQLTLCFVLVRNYEFRFKWEWFFFWKWIANTYQLLFFFYLNASCSLFVDKDEDDCAFNSIEIA